MRPGQVLAVRRYYREGFSMRQIADRMFDVSLWDVRRVIMEAPDLKPRRQGCYRKEDRRAWGETP